MKALAHLRIPPFVHQLTAEEREKMSREDVENDAIQKLIKFLTKHLTELLYDNQIQTKRGITLASGRPVTIRYFELPPTPEKEAFAASVNAEAAKQMPFSMEKAVFGWQEIGEIVKEEKALKQVMVAALQQDIVKIMTDNLKGGGLSNEGVLTLPQALELALPAGIKSAGEKGKVALIHCGHKTTSIMIYKGGVLNFYRDINMGGETITEAIFAGGEVDGQKIEFKTVDEVVELKHKIGVLPPDEVQAMKGAEKWAGQQIFATVEKIFQHIQLSVSFYISQFGETAIDRIILSGGTAAMKNFKEFIQESLEVPAELADPFKTLSPTSTNFPPDRLPMETPALAPAVGVALYDGLRDAKVINFIDIMYPNRRAQAIDFSGVSSKFGAGFAQKLGISLQLDEGKLRILAGLLVVFVLLVGSFPLVKIRQDVTKAKNDTKKLEARLNDLTESQAEVTQLLAEKDLLGREAGLTEALMASKVPLSEILLDLASSTPRQIFLTNAHLQVRSDPRVFRLAGHTDTSDRVFEYLKALNNSTFFKGSALESTEEVPIDEERFFIKFSLAGKIVIPEPPPPPAEGEGGGGEPPAGEPPPEG
ncbi:MAG: pilus assembly protein PilM [Candidatus Riflebacteria bacterium]|nr:pilus assembly protein PilM [Candidatus Riflebacteria bacterium]